MKLGFYGLVGPNIPIASIQSLYSFFTGNGIIQGAFIHQSVTPIQYSIPTEKTKCSFLKDTSICTLPFYIGLHTLGITPNPIGVANTAFINTGNKQYLLFERDLPYEIQIDVPNQQITTFGRKRIPGINHLSGHTKVVDNRVYSLEYSIWKQSVTLLTLTPNLELVKCQEIKTNYIPLVHDFVQCGKSTLFTNSPIQLSISSLLKKQFPIIMTNKSTFIHQVHSDGITTYTSPHSFFIFHYANVVETSDAIELYAPVYYHLNFDRIDIHGIYSKLRLDKYSKTICITSTPELEKYNLDFPVKWKEYTILRNIKGRTITEFVFCKELTIHRTLDMPMAICGEPSIVENTLVCIGYDENFNSYLIQVDLNTNEMEVENMNQTATLGFHSIFIPK